MRRSRIVRAAVALVVVALATVGHVRAEDRSFRSSGECVHLGVSLPVDASAAAELLPDGFVPIEPVPGKAMMAIVTQDCAASIDDGPAARAINSVVFVFLDPVQSPAGCQSYDLFWTNSRRDDWYRAMRRIGLTMHLSPGAALSVSTSVAAAVVAASNPFSAAPFAYDGAGVDAGPAPGPLASVHCEVGPHGLVRQSYDHQFRAGAAVVDVRLGQSDLWQKLGAADTTTPALVARFTWTGLTEIVEPAG